MLFECVTNANTIAKKKIKEIRNKKPISSIEYIYEQFVSWIVWKQ